jgi:hypothetical protein
MGKRRIVILGAAGHDFHDFLVLHRDDPGVQVVAFTGRDPGHREAALPGRAGGGSLCGRDPDRSRDSLIHYAKARSDLLLRNRRAAQRDPGADRAFRQVNGARLRLHVDSDALAALGATS